MAVITPENLILIGFKEVEKNLFERGNDVIRFVNSTNPSLNEVANNYVFYLKKPSDSLGDIGKEITLELAKKSRLG